MKSILLDQNIISFGDLMEFRKINGVIGYTRKIHSAENSWLSQEIKYLPTIERIILQELGVAYTYSELECEEIKWSGSSESQKIGRLFDGVQRRTIPPAIERSFFFQMWMPDYLDKQSMIDFCLFLKSERNDQSIKDHLKRNNAPPEMLHNAENINQFRSFCTKLQAESQYIDAFHIWSAEVFGIDYFLTMDRKIINAAKAISKKCKVVSPSQFCAELGVTEILPIKYDCEYFYSISGETLWKI